MKRHNFTKHLQIVSQLRQKHREETLYNHLWLRQSSFYFIIIIIEKSCSLTKNSLLASCSVILITLYVESNKTYESHLIKKLN